MTALKERVKNKIDTLNSSQILELFRIIKIIEKPSKKRLMNKLKLKTYSCGKRKLNFSRSDAYENSF